MTESLRRVPVADHMWLMAQLQDTLQGAAPLLPLSQAGAPEITAPLPPETALVIHTSGSTGVPKFVALSAAALTHSAHATNEFLGGGGQWLSALPNHLISGIQMLTRSIISGTTPVFYDGKFKPAKFIEHANKLVDQRRYTSLVPAQLHQLLAFASEDQKALDTLQRFNKILVGGGATPLTLRQKAHELGLNIVRTYGMTETAGGIVYDGVEIGDAQVRVRDGQVQLSGSALALGYVGAEELSNKFFIEDAGRRWFCTGDAGQLLGGMLNVTGRIDRVVISGGTNVSLDEVERISAEIPGLETSVAAGVADSQWGTKIVLVVEANDVAGLNTQTLAATVREEVRAKLGAAAAPKELIVLAKIPRLQGAKPDHKAITEALN